MSDELFDVVFYGILQPGKDKALVMQNMATLFKTDMNKLVPYFTGGRKVIKGKINAATAEKYLAALENVGLVLKLEPCMQAAENSQTNQPQSSPPVAAASRQNADTAHANDIADEITLAPVGADVLENPVRAVAQEIRDISFITMAEPGADIIEHPAEHPVEQSADISGITMAEAGSDMRVSPATVPPQKIADISGVSMAEAGADILLNPTPAAKADIPDFSTLSLCDEE